MKTALREKNWVADGGVPITATHGAETDELKNGDEQSQGAHDDSDEDRP